MRTILQSEPIQVSSKIVLLFISLWNFSVYHKALIYIRTQTRNPHAVQPHLRKCFDAISKLEFGTKLVLPEGAAEGEGVELETVLTTDIVAMMSPEQEVVSLGKVSLLFIFS